MLRIFLPALQVGPGLTGVGVYTLELIRGLAHQPLDGEEIVVGAPFPEWFDFLQGIDGFRVEPLPLPRADAWGRMLATHTVVPRLAAQLDADWLVGPNFIAPLWGRCDTAVMVHDLAFRRFPGTTTRAKRLYYQMLVRRSVRRARLIFVSTETVGREITEYAPAAAGKIWRTPEGVSPSYLANGDRGEHPDPAQTRRDLLFVGTLEPRKNLARIVSAHGNVCRRRPGFPRLRIVGGRGWIDEGIHRAMRDH
ncbi:MAG TPA: glycosyltransferase, partial [Candidatus Methylomirabilis sp.]